MYIIPAIDLYNGCAVRLKKGDYEQMTVYSNNPPEFAEKFEKSGAEWLHVVDLEGAKDGTTSNIETVKAIVEKTGMKVEIGGGIRNDETVDKYINIGVSRVILGTAAVKDSAFLKRAVNKYGDKIAVDDLSLHIAPGEIYGFIGHNGAGKTTTLKSVVGILKFDNGEIKINGTSIKQNPETCKREIAYIPDNPDIYDFMTGTKYLNFIADIFGVGIAERNERIKKYADMFELSADLSQPVASYSHGMKQKLAIISAWIHEPTLIIMDEPFVGLDPKASHLLKQMMREVCDNGGAIFFSTHVLEVAEKLCDKIAIIKGGKLIRSGTMEEVKGDNSLEDVFLELEDEKC